MSTKLEQGHWYKEPNGDVWLYLGIGYFGTERVVNYRTGSVAELSYKLDLSTLVEVCFVNGEEMIVGAEYMVESDPKINPFAGERSAIFHGVVDGKPVFKQPWNLAYEPFQKYTLVEPVTTYTLVKSVDGKEVSRVEVSEEKAKELC